MIQILLELYWPGVESEILRMKSDINGYIFDISEWLDS